MAIKRFSNRIQEFLVHLRVSGHAESTISCYKHDLEQLVAVLGNMSLNGVSDRLLKDAIVKIFSHAEERAEALLPATKNRIKSAYRSFFKWACDNAIIPRNPALYVQLSRVTRKEPKTIPITIPEIHNFLRALEESGDPLAARDHALFAVYAYTGVRRSEALLMRYRDFDPVSSTVYLSRAKKCDGRFQVIPSVLVKILSRYLGKPKDRESSAYNSFIFASRSPSAHLSPRQVQQRFEKWKRIAPIRKHLTIHSFRAGFATALYERTRDIYLVACAMGHRDIKTTKMYVSLELRKVRQAIEETFQH